MTPTVDTTLACRLPSALLLRDGGDDSCAPTPRLLGHKRQRLEEPGCANDFWCGQLGSSPGAPPRALPPINTVLASSYKTLPQKIHQYQRQFLRLEYGRGNAAMLLGCAGSGIANGGYMALLDALGSAGSNLPVVGFMCLSGMQMVLLGLSKTYANHYRDNEDMFLWEAAPRDTTASGYCRGLVHCGCADAAQSALLFCAALAYQQAALAPKLVLVVRILSKSAEACIMGVTEGYWNCLKLDLGDEADRACQTKMNRTIVGFESVVQAVVYAAATLGAYIVAAAAWQQEDDNLPRIALGSVVALGAGPSIAALAKLYFFWRGRQFKRTESYHALHTVEV